MQTHPDLIDRIYEAAFVPDLWVSVLTRLADSSGSAAGSFLVFSDPGRPPLFRATELTAPALAAFTSSTAWQDSRRADAIFDPTLSHLPGLRFFYAADYTDVAGDSVDHALASLGLGAQITTLIPLTTNEIVSFTFERRLGEGRHEQHQIERLDDVWPHMARASMIAARLRLEQARAATSALQAIGLPAAVISRAGRVLATNDLLGKMASVFLPGAFGGIALADPSANGLLRQALSLPRGAAVQSIPVKAGVDSPPLVIHLLPLGRSAQDIFAGGDLLLAATTISTSTATPAPTILGGLFDLSPSEARLAAALTRGTALKDYALEAGITFATARKYLDRVYDKTGTHRQNELVALLKGAQPLSSPR